MEGVISDGHQKEWREKPETGDCGSRKRLPQQQHADTRMVHRVTSGAVEREGKDVEELIQGVSQL